MNRPIYSSLITVMVLFVGLDTFAKDKGHNGAHNAIAKLTNSSGEKIGQATLTQNHDGVTIALEASNLPPGKHGFHFHEKGACATPDFKSAGDHFNPQLKKHGLKNPKGPHVGDLPDLEVKEDGTVSTEMKTKKVTLKRGRNSLFKLGGTSLVIHAQPDDQHTDPSGDSGDRIACGIIEVEE